MLGTDPGIFWCQADAFLWSHGPFPWRHQSCLTSGHWSIKVCISCSDWQQLSRNLGGGLSSSSWFFNWRHQELNSSLSASKANALPLSHDALPQNTPHYSNFKVFTLSCLILESRGLRPLTILIPRMNLPRFSGFGPDDISIPQFSVDKLFLGGLWMTAQLWLVLFFFSQRTFSLHPILPFHNEDFFKKIISFPSSSPALPLSLSSLYKC